MGERSSEEGEPVIKVRAVAGTQEHAILEAPTTIVRRVAFGSDSGIVTVDREYWSSMCFFGSLRGVNRFSLVVGKQVYLNLMR